MVCINVAHSGAAISSAMRVDPHLVWAPDHRHVVFNGFSDGDRRVYVADLSQVLLQE